MASTTMVHLTRILSLACHTPISRFHLPQLARLAYFDSMAQNDTESAKECHLVSWTQDGIVVGGAGAPGMYDIGCSRSEAPDFKESILLREVLQSELGVAFFDNGRAWNFSWVKMIAGSKVVLFYGKDDGRAWLLDGRSALLHMTKASLLDADHLKDIHNPTTRAQVDRMLLPGGTLANPTFHDRAKMGLVLRNNEDGAMHRISDIVIRHWHTLVDTSLVLWRLANLGAKLFESSEASNLPRLIGYEYSDAISPTCTVLQARQVMLQDSAVDWLELVRERSAAVFLGHTFDDMIAPAYQRGATDPSSVSLS